MPHWALRSMAVTAIALFTLGAALRAEQAPPVPIERFNKVDERLYRGAQPTEAGFKRLKELGITIVTDVDKKAFQDSVKPVYDKYGAKYGPLMQRIAAVK